MNYENFKNDFNNLLDYIYHKFCLDQMIYAFNDKYNCLYNDTWFTFINKYYSENNNDSWHKIMEELLCLKNQGFRIFIKEIV